MLAAQDAADAPPDQSRFEALRSRLRQLYHGRSPSALRFQAVTTGVDLLIIAFFILSPLRRENAAFLWIDYSVAVIMIAEIAARLLASSNMLRLLRQPTMLLDLFILLTLLAPQWLENFGFLRILRPVSYTHLDVYKRQARRSRPAPCHGRAGPDIAPASAARAIRYPSAERRSSRPASSQHQTCSSDPARSLSWRGASWAFVPPIWGFAPKISAPSRRGILTMPGRSFGVRHRTVTRLL